MLTGDQALSGFIREKIRREGPVTFAWFMGQALYHPEFGYYSSGRAQIGRRGDYFTNVSVGPLFGRLLAGQFAEMWETLGRPGDFAIVEQGAHHGDFARDVLKATAETAPDFFAALRYCIIEPFPVLQQRQAEALGDFAGKVTWKKSLADLEPFCGVHFSNELIDAMPVHLIGRQADSDEWQERCVADSEEGFAFVARPIADENLRRQLGKIPPDLPSPYETEINLAALEWIETVAPKLARGFVLAVDYGYARDQFYAPERTSGTLQCYAGHRRGATPLEGIGRSDITAHVEWTSVAERATECDLTLAGFTDQHHFITGLLSQRTPHESERRALQTLLHPELLGTRFQYLALGKNIPATPLSGFSFARDPRAVLGT
ncbi:MAG TPA: SAM-dependent methyltransferase [Chthoniobacterales bacterium]|nr:SAM-dependent methyltransferase [Chthoniobacterales bacterium]